jgi:hypothetical protein
LALLRLSISVAPALPAYALPAALTRGLRSGFIVDADFAALGVVAGRWDVFGPVLAGRTSRDSPLWRSPHVTMTTSPAAQRQRSALPAVLLAAPLLASADSTIANVAAPTIRHNLAASGSDVQFVVGGYIVAYAVLLVTGARLGQTRGYKRLFLLGVAMFGVTSLADGLAPNIAVLIAVRVLQGASAALMLPQVLTGIQLHFSG